MARGIRSFFIEQIRLKNVIRNIENQKVHHQKKTFSQEYKDLLKKFEVEYDGNMSLKT